MTFQQKLGNRVREIVNGSPDDYSVNSMNQYTQAGSFSYSYDQDGNLAEKTDGAETCSYEYNDDNRLVRSTGPDGEKEYIYNGLGQMAAVIDNGVEHHFMVDPAGFGNVVGEYDASGSLVSHYIHGYGLVGTDENYYTFDGNGNTSEITNAADGIVNFYVYKPFGKALYKVETTPNDFQFAGQFGVRKMGDDLLYMRNRFYAPSLGRFMAEDPIGLAGGDVSFYRYVGNDPVNFVDPEGLWTFGMDYSLTGGAGGGTTGGTTYVIDSKGNYGIVEHAGGGGYFGGGASADGQYQFTTASSISDLGGVSTSLGGSIGEGVSPTGEVLFATNYTGISLGVGAGYDAIGGDLHAFVEVAKVHQLGNIFDDISDLFNSIFGKDTLRCSSFMPWVFLYSCPYLQKISALFVFRFHA